MNVQTMMSNNDYLCIIHIEVPLCTVVVAPHARTYTHTGLIKRNISNIHAAVSDVFRHVVAKINMLLSTEGIQPNI